MEQKTKIKLQNTAEQAAAVVRLGALALVSSALGPIANTVWQIQDMKEAKSKFGKITKEDFVKAIESYVTGFIPYHKALKEELSSSYEKTLLLGRARLMGTAEELAKTGVSYIITLINNAVSVKKVMVFPESSKIQTKDEIVMNVSTPEYNKLVHDFGADIMDFPNQTWDKTSLNQNFAMVIGDNLAVFPTLGLACLKTSDGKIEKLVYPKEQNAAIIKHFESKMKATSQQPLDAFKAASAQKQL